MTLSGQRLANNLVLVATAALAGPGNATILEEVLFRIDLMGTSPLSAIMVNLAENIATPLQTTRDLLAEDLVIVGYASDGTTVTVQAGADGLTVTPELAASMSSGLRAGLYPVGSQLFQLPPAGQLSLYEQSREGEALSQAQALLMSRVDGSITTVITGIVLPDLAPARLASVYDTRNEADRLGFQQISSTVLGAVNTGEILTNVSATWQADALTPQIGLRLAEVSLGANAHVSEAIIDTASASSLSLVELGGSSTNPALVLNLASNGTAIDGHIRTIVQNQTILIGEIMTTTIGALNAGAVNPAPKP